MAEAASFILAALPLVISGLEHYAEGVSTIAKWWSYKRELNSLCRVLGAEYARFLGTCEKLLHGLVSPADLKALLDQPGGLQWRDSLLEKKLKKRLERAYLPYLQSVDDMASAVKELESKLELDPDGKPRWGDYHTFKHEFKRVKFSLSRKGYEDCMKRIEKNNDLLANLTEQNMELEPARKRRRRGGPQFKSIQEHAKTLYSVINRGWTCNCTRPHQANLRLDDRLKDVDADDVRTSATNDSDPSPVQFKVMFSVETTTLPTDATWLWQETEIRVLENEEIEVVKKTLAEVHQALHETENSDVLDKLNANGKTSPIPQHLSMLSSLSLNAARPQPKMSKSWVESRSRKTVNFAIPAGTVDLESTETVIGPVGPVQFMDISSRTTSEMSSSSTKEEHVNLVRIDNLCLAIHKCMENMVYSQRCLGYLSHEARRLGIYVPQVPQNSRQKQSITSLAQLLSSKQQNQNQYLAATGNLSLRRGDRLGLALTVASSVLQLYKTPWLREYWDKNDIMINGDCITNVREQVYVSKSFPAEIAENSTESRMFPLRNVTLFALGIVLIELCLGQPLETLRVPEDPLDSNGKANVLTNWSTANRMTEAVYSEAGTRYGDAVRRCLHCDFDQRSTNLENDAFRQAVYDGVVAPLEDDVKDFFQL